MNQLKEEGYFIPALEEEEAIEVECLLVEPQMDQVSVDGVLCFHKENLEKCMEIKDIPCKFGGQDSKSTGEEEDILQLKVLDVMPHRVEVGTLQAANGVYNTCEDYLLDFGFAESITKLDSDSSEGLHLSNSGSESQNPEFSSGDFGTVRISKSSTSVIPVPDSQNKLLDVVICELPNNFSFKGESGTSIEATRLECPSSSESKIADKLGEVSNPLVGGVSSDKKEKHMFFPVDFFSGGMSCSSMILKNKEVKPVDQGVDSESVDGRDILTKSFVQDSNVGALLTQKRLRKPTRRYIDESPDLKARNCRKRQENSTSTSKDKFLGVRFFKHRHMRSKAVILSSEESFGNAIQVPFCSEGRKECRKKHTSVMVQSSDEEPSPARPEDDFVTAVRFEESGGQRKHHRPWTLSEVRKLIDGVSHYGVGRWTQIKKLSFSSSAHRTSVDLKDKWRNLLKASYAQKQSKGQDEQKRNTPWRPLPKSMLRRVSELGIIYPYPRDGKSKFSNIHHASSPTLPARTTGTPLHHSGRIGHRKNCT